MNLRDMGSPSGLAVLSRMPPEPDDALTGHSSRPGKTGNIAPPLLDNRQGFAALLLNCGMSLRSVAGMKRLFLLLFLALVLPAAAQADCYVEYKAKRDAPLRLHYGIALLPGGDCPGKGQTADALRSRLAGSGWTLLNVVGSSTKEPGKKKKANAGDYYLRF
ncbi:hypothetical protein [Salipiger thiooxidans]|uniref:hypothetical protein n=1 Tax=Salipiger thiooxidans TaxID=282683 RepID=UPI0030F3D37B